MYLTKADRESIILLVGIEGALTELEEKWVEYNRPKTWIKALRMAKTWVGKISDAIAEMISKEDKLKTYSMLSKYQVILVPNAEAKQILKSEEMISVHNDVLNDLAEAVMISQCDGCNKEEFESCKYRTALMDASIPAFDAEAVGCQYKY